MKKIILSIGAIATLAIPATVAISCGSDDTTTIVYEREGVTFKITNNKTRIEVDNVNTLTTSEIISKIKTEAAKDPVITLPTADTDILKMVDANVTDVLTLNMDTATTSERQAFLTSYMQKFMTPNAMFAITLTNDGKTASLVHKVIANPVAPSQPDPHDPTGGMMSNLDQDQMNNFTYYINGRLWDHEANAIIYQWFGELFAAPANP